MSETNLAWSTTFTDDEKEIVPCPLCASLDYQKVVEEWSLAVVRCRTCGLMYTNPRLKGSHLNYWFEENEAETRQKFMEKYGAVLRGEKAHPRDRHYEKHLEEIAQVKPTGELLDVGAHCGFLMRLAKNWHVTGVEPSPLFARFAQEYFGLDVRIGLLHEVDLPKHHYDVVVMTDVLEHVANPREVLGQVHALLKSDGLVYIKIPNGNWSRVKQWVLVRLLGRKNFDIWDCREHVVHYTPRTLRKMLEASGYRVRRIGLFEPVQAGKKVHLLRLLAWSLSSGIYWMTGWVSPFSASLIAEAQPRETR